MQDEMEKWNFIIFIVWCIYFGPKKVWVHLIELNSQFRHGCEQYRNISVSDWQMIIKEMFNLDF